MRNVNPEWYYGWDQEPDPWAEYDGPDEPPVDEEEVPPED